MLSLKQPIKLQDIALYFFKRSF